MNQRLAQIILEKEGHGVVVAENGVVALEAHRDARFDVVLMDVQMPRMDGIEATTAIRNRERTTGEHVPIVALTAYAMTGDRDRCLAAGMDGYLTKPIEPAALLRAIARPLVVARPATAAPPAEGSTIDRAALSERVDGDHELLQEIVVLFLRHSGPLMANVRHSMATPGAPGWADSVHTLLGMFRNVGANSARDLAEALQRLDPEGNQERVEALYLLLEQEVQAVSAELASLVPDFAAVGSGSA